MRRMTKSDVESSKGTGIARKSEEVEVGKRFEIAPSVNADRTEAVVHLHVGQMSESQRTVSVCTVLAE